MGFLTCSAGVSFAHILSVLVPKGWFPPVTPGTKFVTVGGAIASDIHGKNHHLEGSFTDHVSCLKIATVSDGIVECSRERHPEMFQAPCGGMGLTGVILEATFGLKPIEERLHRRNHAQGEDPRRSPWIFLQSTIMRPIPLLGSIARLAAGHLGGLWLCWANTPPREDSPRGKSLTLIVPVDMPSFVLNRYTIRAFNALYYNLLRKKRTERRIHYEPFFYPLDGIRHWNRLYGKNGFTQYQFVIPKQASLEGLTTVLERIAASKHASALAVPGKRLVKTISTTFHSRWEGCTLALDFMLDTGLC